ncbi:MAG TPA: lipoyl synthase, partial [Arcobacter skirrowii]|nr:lipoyl synthase [Aliarcobacter skirrowii]
MTQQIDFKERANFKKPEWLRKKLTPHAQIEMENLLKDVGGLHTICQEAKCPNISECFANKNATFLILGNICTRRCTYCNVTT